MRGLVLRIQHIAGQALGKGKIDLAETRLLQKLKDLGFGGGEVFLLQRRHRQRDARRRLVRIDGQRPLRQIAPPPALSPRCAASRASRASASKCFGSSATARSKPARASSSALKSSSAMARLKCSRASGAMARAASKCASASRARPSQGQALAQRIQGADMAGAAFARPQQQRQGAFVIIAAHAPEARQREQGGVIGTPRSPLHRTDALRCLCHRRAVPPRRRRDALQTPFRTGREP